MSILQFRKNCEYIIPCLFLFHPKSIDTVFFYDINFCESETSRVILLLLFHPVLVHSSYPGDLRKPSVDHHSLQCP
jgi:hypothetical protein